MSDPHEASVAEMASLPPSPKGGWTPEQHARFKRTMRRKKRLEAEARQAMTNGQEGAFLKHSPRPEDLPHVLVCPRCGLNMRNVALAIAFSDQQTTSAPT